MTNKYTTQQKVDFFDANWKYLDRIMNTVQESKMLREYILPGDSIFRWLAEWLENLEKENN